MSEKISEIVQINKEQNDKENSKYNFKAINIVTNSTKSNIDEGFKTYDAGQKTTEFNSFITQNVGEPHPFDYEVVEVVSEKVGLVNAIIDKYSDFTIGKKMMFKGDDNIVDFLTNWIEDCNFFHFVKPWFKEGLKKGTAYLEVADLLQPSMVPAIKVVNSNTIFIKKDKFGNFEGFNQYLGSTNRTDITKIQKLDSDEIIPLKCNYSGNKCYGVGIIYPALEAINNFGETQSALHKIVKRKANSPLHAQLGDAEKEDYPDQTDIDAFGNKLTYMNETTEWVTGPNVKFEVVNFGDIGEKFMTILDNDYKLMSYCFQVPEMLLGSDRGFTGSSEVQMDGFIKRCNSYKGDIIATLKMGVFDKVLKINGLDGHYEIVFDTDSEEERNKKIAQYKEVLTLMQLSPVMRMKIEEKIAELLDLQIDEKDFVVQQLSTDDNKSEDEMDKDDSKDDINDENLRTKLDKIKEHLLKNDCCCHEAYATEQSNYTLQEWLNFDLRNTKQPILEVIKSDNFSDIAAQNRKEIYLGKFNKKQVEDLRQILYDGVNEGKSLNEIEEQINKTIKLRDRYILDKDGNKVLKVSKDARAKEIARSEISRLGNEGKLISFEDKGISNVMFESFDTACPECMALNGSKYKTTEAYGLIPVHPYCRCSFKELQ